MAKQPAAEECGRKVLDVCKRFNLRPDEYIPFQSLISDFTSGQWRATDLETGLQWCFDQGYLIEHRDHAYFLTESGYEVM